MWTDNAEYVILQKKQYSPVHMPGFDYKLSIFVHITHDAHTPGIAPWSLFTHHWSGGPAGGWGGEVGSTQPHCMLPL